MSWPLTPEKSQHPSVIRSEEYVKKYGKNFSFKNIKKAVLCFCPVAAHKLLTQSRSERRSALGAYFDFYEKEKTVLVSSFGMGAPAAVVCLEHLKSFGVQKIFSLGWAGAFSGGLALGDLVFIEKAFRDEGCSYHYRPKKSDNPFVKSVAEGKRPFKQSFAKPVTSWTTDAPYRETEYEFEKWRKRGASCVEMEASALMTVGSYYSLSVFCFAVISDIQESGGWKMDFSNKKIHKRLYESLKYLVFSPF